MKALLAKMVFTVLLALATSHIVQGQLAPEPTLPSYNLIISNITATSVQLDWSAGNGGGRIIFFDWFGAPMVGYHRVPNDGATYSSGSFYGSGGFPVGGHGLCTYNGAGNSAAIINLIPNTNYDVYIYEYNGQGATANYLQNPRLESSFQTLPLVSVDDPEENDEGIIFSSETPADQTLAFRLAIPAIPMTSCKAIVNNLNGQSIFQSVLKIQNHKEPQALDVSGFAPGLYFLTIESQAGFRYCRTFSVLHN